MRKSYLKVIEQLELLSKRREKSCVGICALIYRETGVELHQLPDYKLICERWKLFTGEITFPVPHPTKSPYSAYLEGDFWSGEYGRNRRAFARYLAKEFRKLLTSPYL